MIRIIEGAEKPGTNPLLDAMHRDRKRVFVDFRKWNVPVVNGEFEIDQFDGPRTVYCIASDEYGAHNGSIRLLPSTAPHILGDLFPELCDEEVPTGPGIWELTRACLSPRLTPMARKQTRNALTTAVVEYALYRGITAYTCIADSGWWSQVLALGWDCRPLGLPRLIDRTMTGALQIEITPATPTLLEQAGTYIPCRLVAFDDALVAHA
ncbi:autoinducer synthase [Sphingobium sp. LB126]|nr:autoinducer synthase [Sphingobium sp. LB126]